MKNPRLLAVKKLTKLLDEKLSLANLLKSDDPPLTKEICYGVTRYYFQLNSTLNDFVKKKPAKTEIYVVLLTGIYQLKYLNKPDYAVVKESVDILIKLKMPWAKGLVNAVLRNVCRQKETVKKNLKLESTYNHPEWLINKIKKYYPSDWEKILAANDSHPPLTIRVNQQKISEEEYLAKLDSLNIKALKLPFSGIKLETATQVQDIPGFTAGEVSVQDQAAQLCVSLLALQPGLSILDACSAPGGKLCHILEAESKLSKCVALEIDEKRIIKIKENLTRLGLTANVIQADATQSSWWDGKPFDRILLDAPCSATGVIKRHPDIKILRTPNDVIEICKLQKKLLENLWPKLGKGGILVYVTCSILFEENEEQIKNFVTLHPDAQAEQFNPPWGIFTGHGYQILSSESNMDGFFYSKLRKI